MQLRAVGKIVPNFLKDCSRESGNVFVSGKGGEIVCFDKSSPRGKRGIGSTSEGKNSAPSAIKELLVRLAFFTGGEENSHWLKFGSHFNPTVSVSVPDLVPYI